MERRTFVLGFLAVVGCGKGAKSGVETRTDIDSGPLAILPGSAVVVGYLNARAMFADTSVNAAAAAVGHSFAPLGAEAGFDVSRDLDRVVVAVYSTTGADVAAVLSGRFDEAKIAAATKGKDGLEVIHGAYAGRVTYTVGSVSYAVLTERTLVAGTRDGLRRVLERLQSGNFEPALPTWMVAALQTKGADVAVVADFVTQPVAAVAVSSLPWLNGLRTARMVGNFGSPGMNVAGTLSYADPQQAQTANDGLHKADRWLRVVGPLLGGIGLQNLEATTEGSDARCKFAVDDHALIAFLGLLPRVLPVTP